RVQAAAVEFAVALVFPRLLAGGGRHRADALAVDVRGEDVVAHRRELPATVFLVVGQAGPLVDHQHRRALAFGGVVVNVDALQRHSAVLVFDGLLDQGGGGGSGGEQGQEKRFHPHQQSEAEGGVKAIASEPESPEGYKPPPAGTIRPWRTISRTSPAIFVSTPAASANSGRERI